MVIVVGHLLVDPRAREAYLAGCAEVVRRARAAEGCLDFTITADLLEDGRIDVLERWVSQEAVQAFRGDGPGGEQAAAVLSASVCEYDVCGQRSLR
ncbi:putative quinol monooxygenase [Kineococcus indalonis]|uniref:putative quinol monooxygenase n=1 Tax=Kineococcus indalonis TaxID=2696566 RepID=UPI001411DE68|nr:antibiotic biosynthesis monooxygenase [Kineococcus indalonis]NAZ85420.1 antibiotic biosynthesis monooxygenase [Kineococcus indalonis]